MTSHPSLVISALDGSHERSGFHCGVPSLDDYLHKQAGQDVRRRISRVFVATTPTDPRVIVGYYTLSSLSVEPDRLPDKLARKLPRHPIPAALLGRLAVDRRARSCGVGRMLLVDAIRRTLAVSDEIAIHAMIVDAIDDHARGFYEQFGFSPLGSGNHCRLFLPLESAWRRR